MYAFKIYFCFQMSKSTKGTIKNDVNLATATNPKLDKADLKYMNKYCPSSN